MSRARLAAAALVVALAGCGGESWLAYEGVRPPAGAEAAGARPERQGGPDPDAGEPIFRLRPREGETIGYAVSVRNDTDREIAVTGVVADEDRDGAFVPRSVAGVPVRIAPGGRERLEVQGEVRGCDYGGQAVPLAGPELRLRDAAGEEASQIVELDRRIELIVEGC